MTPVLCSVRGPYPLCPYPFSRPASTVFYIGSNVMLFWLHLKAEKLDVNKRPVGGARLENIGNIVYSQLAHYHSNLLVLLIFRLFVCSSLPYPGFVNSPLRTG